MRVLLTLWLVAVSSAGAALRPPSAMSHNFLRALETGVQASFSPLRRKDALYKNDMIKLHLGEGVIFKSYCNTHCSQLRQLAGIMDAEFANSLNELSSFNPDSKSGHALWKTDNGLIILKTMPKCESKTLRRIIEPYTAHVSADHEQSCLSLILGMYSLSVKGKTVYLVACNNIFPQDPSCVVEMYDVKGSTVGRKASATSKVMKDVDALIKMRNSEERILKLDKSYINRFIKAVEYDVSFLENLNLMDYSLLVGIESQHNERLNTSNTNRDFSSITSEQHVTKGKMVVPGDRPRLKYHMGIVDFLQEYSAKKRLETIGKGMWYNSSLISAVNAKFYANRFLHFIKLLGGIKDH